MRSISRLHLLSRPPHSWIRMIGQSRPNLVDWNRHKTAWTYAWEEYVTGVKRSFGALPPDPNEEESGIERVLKSHKKELLADKGVQSTMTNLKRNVAYIKGDDVRQDLNEFKPEAKKFLTEISEVAFDAIRAFVDGYREARKKELVKHQDGLFLGKEYEEQIIKLRGGISDVLGKEAVDKIVESVEKTKAATEGTKS